MIGPLSVSRDRSTNKNEIIAIVFPMEQGFPNLLFMGTLSPFINSLVYPQHVHILFCKKNSLYEPKTWLEDQKKRERSSTQLFKWYIVPEFDWWPKKGLFHNLCGILPPNSIEDLKQVSANWCQRVPPIIYPLKSWNVPLVLGNPAVEHIRSVKRVHHTVVGGSVKQPKSCSLVYFITLLIWFCVLFVDFCLDDVSVECASAGHVNR